MSRLALGMDLGTTAVKAVVLDESGAIVASASAPLDLIVRENGLAEQDVPGLWAGAAAAVRKSVDTLPARQDIRCLALSSQGGTLIRLDAHGMPTGRAISWLDTRPAALGKKLLCGHGHAFYYGKTGWGLRSGCLPLAQLIRLRLVGGGAIPRVRFVDSYVVERLTGQAATNPSDAAITMLYDVRGRRWDAELLGLAGVDAAALPRIVPSGTVLGPLRGEAAAELGLPPKAAVVAGAHDQYCAAFGAGCRAAGDTIISCGTAWVLLAMAAEPCFDYTAQLAPAEAVTAGLWGLLGSCSGVGFAAEWFRRFLAPGGEVPFSTLEAAAAEVRPSPGAPVVVLPVAGASGRLVGFGLHHSFGHLARAVLESAAFSARALLERMQGVGAAPSRLRAVGGATRSRLWMQMVADATGLPLEVAGTQDVAAYGAARLAGEATGLIAPDSPWPRPAARIEPRRRHRATYNALYERFQEARR